jgi:hypothetical protein
MSRIKDQPYNLTYTLTYFKTIDIGYNNCQNCGMETPDPPESVLIDFHKKTQGRANFIWPGSDWIPEGWTSYIALNTLICPECTNVVTEALRVRKILIDEENKQCK